MPMWAWCGVLLKQAGGEVMSGIPRYRMTNNLGELDNDNGSWIKYEDHVVAVNAAVEAERVRCLDIVENIHGVAVLRDGYRWLDPHGESISRSRVETAIRWVKVKWHHPDGVVREQSSRREDPL